MPGDSDRADPGDDLVEAVWIFRFSREKRRCRCERCTGVDVSRAGWATMPAGLNNVAAQDGAGTTVGPRPSNNNRRQTVSRRKTGVRVESPALQREGKRGGERERGILSANWDADHILPESHNVCREVQDGWRGNLANWCSTPCGTDVEPDGSSCWPGNQCLPVTSWVSRGDGSAEIALDATRSWRKMRQQPGQVNVRWRWSKPGRKMVFGARGEEMAGDRFPTPDHAGQRMPKTSYPDGRKIRNGRSSPVWPPVPE